MNGEEIKQANEAKKKLNNQKRKRVSDLIKLRAERRENSNPITNKQKNVCTLINNVDGTEAALPVVNVNQSSNINQIKAVVVIVHEPVVIHPSIHYVKQIIDCVNSCDFEELTKVLTDICIPTVVEIHLYDGEVSPFGPNRHDVYGVKEIIAMFQGLHAFLPDIVYTIHKVTHFIDEQTGHCHVQAKYTSDFVKTADFAVSSKGGPLVPLATTNNASSVDDLIVCLVDTNLTGSNSSDSSSNSSGHISSNTPSDDLRNCSNSLTTDMRYFFSGIFSLDVNTDGKVEVLKFFYKEVDGVSQSNK